MTIEEIDLLIGRFSEACQNLWCTRDKTKDATPWLNELDLARKHLNKAIIEYGQQCSAGAAHKRLVEEAMKRPGVKEEYERLKREELSEQAVDAVNAVFAKRAGEVKFLPQYTGMIQIDLMDGDRICLHYLQIALSKQKNKYYISLVNNPRPETVTHISEQEYNRLLNLFKESGLEIV